MSMKRFALIALIPLTVGAACGPSEEEKLQDPTTREGRERADDELKAGSDACKVEAEAAKTKAAEAATCAAKLDTLTTLVNGLIKLVSSPDVTPTDPPGLDALKNGMWKAEIADPGGHWETYPDLKCSDKSPTGATAVYCTNSDTGFKMGIGFDYYHFTPPTPTQSPVIHLSRLSWDTPGQYSTAILRR